MEGELLQSRQQLQAHPHPPFPDLSHANSLTLFQVLQQACDSERRLKQAAELRCETISRDLNQYARTRKS